MHPSHAPTLTVKPHPFAPDTTVVQLQAGMTIVDVLNDHQVQESDGCHLHVSIDGRVIPRDRWQWEKLEPEQLVTVQAIPHDGGGGAESQESKNIGSIIAGVVLIIVGVVLVAYGGYFGVSLITMGLGLVAGGVAGLIAPFPQLAGPPQQDERIHSLTGIQNRANPWGMVPLVYGRHRIFPTFGAQQFTEIVGDDQYIRAVFVMEGPVSFSDHRIGGVPIADLEGVQIETRSGLSGDSPLTLYPYTWVEKPIAIEFDAPDWVSGNTTSYKHNITAPATDQISLDVTFPEGIIIFPANGGRASQSVFVTIEYKLVTSGTWLNPFGGEVEIPGFSSALLRRNYTWDVASGRGQYDIRMRFRFVGTTNPNDTVRGRPVWTVVRSITIPQTADEEPIQGDGLAKIAIRIKASGQLEGFLDSYNCIVQRLVAVWNGSSWDENQATRNPTWAYTDILTNPTINPQAVSRDRIDTTTMLDWATNNAAAGRSFDRIFEARPTVFQALQEIGPAGRASYQMKSNGLHSVVQDTLQTIPRQLFNRRNILNYRGSRGFPDELHGLRISFKNERVDWGDDERVVYDDGYTAANATKFQNLRFPGVTDPEAIFKLGRYWLADLRLRPERHLFETDMEFLVAQRGDLVLVQHDVMVVGLGGRRVTAVGTSGSDVTTITLDRPVEMEMGKSYGVRIRMTDGSTVEVNQHAVDTVVGEQETLTFTTPIPNSVFQPVEDDLVSFGLFDLETLPCLIHAVEPRGSDLRCTVTCINEGAGVHDADTGPIPAHDPKITLPTDFGYPPEPVIDALTSDDFVSVKQPDGSTWARIIVSLKPQPPVGNPNKFTVLLRWKEAEGEDWQNRTYPYLSNNIYAEPVNNGVTYDIEVRNYNLLNGHTSKPTTVQHTVDVAAAVPPDIDSITTENNWVVWSYASRPSDFLGYEVRYRQGNKVHWDSGIKAHDNFVSETRFSLDSIPPGTQTVMVKAVDRLLNYSTNPAAMITDLGLPLEEQNIIFTYDEHGAGFPGTITDGTVVGGDLLADDIGDTFWPTDPNSKFWQTDPDSLFWASAYKEMVYEFSIGISGWFKPFTLRLETDIEADSYTIEYQGDSRQPFWQDDSAPFWADDATPFWDQTVIPFRPWPHELKNAQASNYTFRITTSPGRIRGAIRSLTVVIDVDDVREFFENLSLSASGTIVTPTKAFKYIKGVEVTPNSPLGQFVNVQVQKINNATAVVLTPIDTNGQAVDGVADVELVGY